MKRTLAALLAAVTTASLAACSLDSHVAVRRHGQRRHWLPVQDHQHRHRRNPVEGQGIPGAASRRRLQARRARSTTCSGRTTTRVRPSPRRWSPRRSTSARWATTRCSSTAPRPRPTNARAPSSSPSPDTARPDRSTWSSSRRTRPSARSPTSKGKKVSASVGSAGHGTLVRALDNAGIDPKTGVEVLNQQPQVGASALESGQAQALSQFVAWPGLLVFQNKAKLLYDGAEGDYPTFHGVVVRSDYAQPAPRGARRVPAGPTRRHRVPQPEPARVGQARRRRQRPAAGGRLPLQRTRAAPASTPR